MAELGPAAASRRASQHWLVAGVALLILAGFCVLAAVLSDRPWQGPISWRKPLLFAVATSVSCLSLGAVYASICAGGTRTWAAVGALAAFVEVGLITLQTMRGVPSHFNAATPLDAGIAWAIDAAVTLLVAAIVFATWAAWAGRVRTTPDLRAAWRIGLVLLLVGCGFGYFMLVYGTQRVAAGLDPGRWGAAGVLKFVHGMPLHAVQILPLLAWGLARVGIGPRRRRWAARRVGVLLWLSLALAAWQTFGGRARHDLDPGGWLLLLVIVGLCVHAVWMLAGALPKRTKSCYTAVPATVSGEQENH